MTRAEKIVEAILALDSAAYALKVVTSMPNEVIPKVFLEDPKIEDVAGMTNRLKAACRLELERRLIALAELDPGGTEEIPEA